jgi:hypothetical protein
MKLPKRSRRNARDGIWKWKEVAEEDAEEDVEEDL